MAPGKRAECQLRIPRPWEAIVVIWETEIPTAVNVIGSTFVGLVLTLVAEPVAHRKFFWKKYVIGRITGLDILQSETWGFRESELDLGFIRRSCRRQQKIRVPHRSPSLLGIRFYHGTWCRLLSRVRRTSTSSPRSSSSFHRSGRLRPYLSWLLESV